MKLAANFFYFGKLSDNLQCYKTFNSEINLFYDSKLFYFHIKSVTILFYHSSGIKKSGKIFY